MSNEQFVTHTQLKDELRPIHQDLAEMAKNMAVLSERVDGLVRTLRYLVGVVVIPMLAMAYKLVIG